VLRANIMVNHIIIHSSWTLPLAMPSFVLPLVVAVVGFFALRWLYRSAVEAMTRMIQVFVGGSADTPEAHKTYTYRSAPEAQPSAAELDRLSRSRRFVVERFRHSAVRRDLAGPTAFGARIVGHTE
jgi:hypothetical protein